MGSVRTTPYRLREDEASDRRDPHPRWRLIAVLTVAGLAIACFAVYLPFLGLPFISDDYLQIYLGRHYGDPAGWGGLAQDPLYRCRATSLVVTWLVDAWFGVTAAPHNIVSLLFHILNCILVAALGFWNRIGWRVSLPAALFFAIHEGHQEAVVWISALHDLLVFFFGVLAFLCWILWLQLTGRRRHLFLAAAALFFLLALASKESSVAFLPLFALAWWLDHRTNKAALLPLAAGLVLCGVYAYLIFTTTADHQHLRDGSFSWNAPFWLTIPHSMVRMFWIWGFISLAVLWRYRHEARWAVVTVAVAWAAIGFAPYSFLTFMTRVPSRHTYLASLGLALLAGAAYVALRENVGNRRPWAMALALILAVAHNAGFLWIHKLPQYERRAAPTERFIRFARSTDAPIRVECFPFPLAVVPMVVATALDRSPESVQIAAAEQANPSTPGAVRYCDDSTI